MSEFYIEKLVVKGAGKKDAIAEFSDELTIISGPSNTGKTCIRLITQEPATGSTTTIMSIRLIVTGTANGCP